MHYDSLERAWSVNGIYIYICINIVRERESIDTSQVLSPRVLGFGFGDQG